MASKSTNTAIFMSPPFLEEFIAEYQKCPALWDQKSLTYSNRREKDLSTERLLKFVRQTIPTADVDFMKRRIEVIRGCFRKECNKIKNSMKSGERIHRPKLWYFPYLSFLSNEKFPAYAIKRPKVEYDVEEEEVEVENTSALGSPTRETPAELQMEEDDSESINPLRDEEEDLKLIRAISERFLQPKPLTDRFDTLGNTVATKMRELPKSQRILAENLLNEVLFLAEIGQLTLAHTIHPPRDISQDIGT